MASQPGMIWTEMLTNAEGVDDPTWGVWNGRCVLGNPSKVSAQSVVRLAEQPNGSGKMYPVRTPRVCTAHGLGDAGSE